MKIIAFLQQRRVPADTYINVYQMKDGVEYRTTYPVYGGEASQ